MRNSQIKLTEGQIMLLEVADRLGAHMAAALHYSQLQLHHGNHGDHLSHLRWLQQLLEARARELAEKRVRGEM